MNPRTAKAEFEQFLAGKGLDVSNLTVDRGISVMLDFYRDVRADGCDERDADMLLYQWGPESDGPGSAIDITRQLTFDGDEDESIWQLALTFTFPPDSTWEGLDSGNKWCSSPHPKALEHFLDFIRNTDAYVAALEKGAPTVELDYVNAG